MDEEPPTRPAGIRHARDCAECDKVTHLDIRTMIEPDKRRALCFVRIESESVGKGADAQPLLMTLREAKRAS